MNESEKEFDPTIFQQIAEQTSETWFLYDLNTKRFTYLGPTFEAIWQRKPENLLENPASVLDFIHPDDQEYLVHNYEAFLQEKTSVRLDFRILHPDGKERWIALKTYPIKLEGQVRVVAGFAEDDTPRKENLIFLQAINGKKNASLEIISHDLRGPLGMVKSFTDLIDKKTASLADPHLRQYTHLIREVCQRNVNLIRSLTQQEYLESPQVEVDRERLDLVGEIQSVMDNYQQSQQHIAKEFSLTSSKETVYAEVDSMKFVSIVNNLVSNAIKFTPENGQIHLHLEEKQDTVLLTVQDNGVGIPAKYQSVLFDKFSKARRPGLQGEETIGLGMSIVKQLVDLHQGKIWFESQEQQGTTFFVELPKKEISIAKL